MPPQTIHAKIYSRTLGLSGPGPIYTCTKLIAVERRDGAGEFRAEFPSSDTMLQRITLKQTYLEFEVGGKFFFFGLVERIWTETDDKGRQTTVVSGRDQLGALAENTVGDLTLEYAFDAPEQIISAADVPNQNFSLSAEGFSVTGYPFTKQFAGESALSALTKVAADIGEHFRAPKAALLEVVWMSTNTPDAPVRLVTAGGPLLHENPDVAIISHIERDENGESMANRIYPYGAGVGAARLTLEHATIGMPAGYSMDTASNYIQNDNEQSLPSVRKAIQKVWNHIGVDIGQTYTIQVDTTALTGATTIIVETIAVPMTTGTLLDLNGGGTDFVELSANVSIGANVLNVVTTTFDVLDTDTLVYTPADAQEAAANTLAYAAVTHLQRISEPTRMVAYKLTVRGLPDAVTVGMKIPVLSQAPGFAIDDDLIILEITRTVTRNGQMPAVVKVVPADWFDLGEAGSIATTMENFRVSQAQGQPVSYASVDGVDVGIAGTIDGADESTSLADTDRFALIVSSVLTWISWGTIKSALVATFLTFTNKIAIAATATSGAALSVVRDLAAASTDSPVVSIVQDNASDDQPALRVQQDGSGAVIVGYDGATKVFELSDGGTLNVYTVIKALSASGISVQDDGGNEAMLIEDGGFVNVTSTNAAGSAVIRYTNDGGDSGGTSQIGVGGSANANAALADRLILYGRNASGVSVIATATAGGDIRFYSTLAAERACITSAGDFGIGTTAPQGLLHAVQGSGSFMFEVKAGIVGTKVVIIANGTGDVTQVLTGFFTLSDGTSGVANAISMIPTDTYAIAVGGSTWTLTLAANGEFSVQRTAGSGTATMTFMITWI